MTYRASRPSVFQVKLSAVLEMLHNIRYDKEERRHLIRDLCVSAYPDVLPWQVRRSCLDPTPESIHPQIQASCSNDELEDLYYSYLSQLLHPFDGNDKARHDKELLQEYCEWSVGIRPNPAKKRNRVENFLNIASRSSIQHTRYKRDLMMLLRLGVVIGKEDLVLDLGKWLVPVVGMHAIFPSSLSYKPMNLFRSRRDSRGSQAFAEQGRFVQGFASIAKAGQ